MKRKPTALIITLLLFMVVAMLWLQTTPDGNSTSESAASTEPGGRPGTERAASMPPDADEARRLSPPAWTPPAVFAKAGAPAPQKIFPRGENASRQYPAPETSELPRRLRGRVPSVLAMTPADGRLHLLAEEIDLHTRLARRMVFDPAALDHIIAGKASRVLAPTTGDEVLTLEFHALKTRSPQSHTLLGRVVGEEETSDVLVVYHDGVIHGSVARYADIIDQHLEYRILTDGHMMVRQLDPSTMTATCGNGPETAAEGLIDESSEEGFEIIPQGDGEVSEDTPGWRTIDIVVGYDAGARAADGGYSQIEARIIASVDRMTTAFANSLINNTELMLLGTIEDPIYVFPGDVAGSMGTNDELGNLNNFATNNPALNAVSDYYTLLGADLVAFVTKQADGSAGIAYRPGRASVTARDYMTSTRITFGHELAHNLGCDHSWGDSSQSYHSHYGWRLDPPGTVRVRTIMAYDWGWGNGHRIPYFANPSVSYNGAATGAVNKYNVEGDATADQRYYQNGLNYSNGVYGFNGANSALGANNANTINTGGGVSNYGATFASNRATRASFAVTSPVAGTELSRGTSQNIFFRGGDMQDLATIQLFKGGVLQSTLASNLNPATRRNFSWVIPESIPGGMDYMIRVTLNHPGGGISTADSGIFTILGSAPLILSHAPAASPPVGGPVSQVSLTFNQPMNPASFSIGTDVLSFTGPQGLTLAATGASWSSGNSVLNIQFPAQSLPGYYRMVISPEIANMDGDFLDQNLNDITGEPIDDSYIASFQISGGGGTPETLWSDMVGTDAPDAGWTFSGTNSSWQTGTPTSNPSTTFDGGPIIGQNLAGDYNTLENSFAESPVIDGSSHTNLTLSFRGWKGAGRNDTLYVDAWNGSSWQRVFSYTGPNGGASDSSWTLYQPALGTHGDLNPDFKLRWGLMDVTIGNSGTQTGWQLDSIVVQGTPDASPPAAWVTSHFPQGMVEDFQSSVWLEFSQAMDTGSFALSDIAAFTGPSGSITATGFQWLHPTLLRIDFPAQSALGQYALTLAPTVLDEAGRLLDQDFDGTPGEPEDDVYVAAFQIGTTADPVDRFEITGIPASVIYGTTIDGITITARDTENKIAATFNGTVTLGGTAGITGTTANFTDGVLSNVSITPPIIGSGLTIIVDDGEGHTGNATLTVSPIPAAIEFVSESLNQTYDGTPRTVTATTDPPGLDYSVSYQDEPGVPVNAGGYDVSATIITPNYQGSVSDTLVIAPIEVDIALGNLSQTYDGSPKPVNVTTDPTPVAYTVTYDGAPDVPINAGSYEIVVTITEPNHSGSASDTLVIEQGGPGPVDSFAISSIDSPQTVGTPITGITVTALDADDEIATDFTGTVTFGGTAGITGTSASFVDGVLTGVSVTPTVAGSVLTFTVDDGAGHTGTITIDIILSIFDDWASANGLTDDDALPDADPDGDGLNNLQEFAFGTNPTAGASGPIAYAPGGSVTKPGTPVSLNIGADFHAVFGRRKDYQAAGLSYTVEFSAGLDVWVPGDVEPAILTGENSDGDIEAVSVPYPLLIPVDDGHKKPTFFRVGVSMN